MKKLLPLIILAVLACSAYYFSLQRSAHNSADGTATTSGSQSSAGGGSATDGSGPMSTLADGSTKNDENEGQEDTIIKPASQAYKTAEEALAALKKGAGDYDDMILEQFTEPGEDCTFCGEMYKQVRDMMTSGQIPQEQLNFYGELLAISGRPENLQTLVDGIKHAQTPEAKEAYAESLELALGHEDTVKFLGEQLNSPDNRLREASVSAITNQGSRAAAETLYKDAVTRGDPDGYYSQGIGLGELVPDDETMPFLQEMVNKRDQYSNLAVKALLNSGVAGLKIVMDTLANSSDPAADQAMLKDAVDHVSFEDETESYLKRFVAESKKPGAVDFANKVLESFKGEETAESSSEEVSSETEE